MSNNVNILELIQLSELIKNTTNLETLNKIAVRLGDYKHPLIYRDLGTSYFIKGDRTSARKYLIKGAEYGLKYPCIEYDNQFVDAIGQCLYIILTEFPVDNNNVTYKATLLSYLFLSRCIELYPREAQDSYRSRAILFKNHKIPNIIQMILIENLGGSVLIEPFIISDYFFSAKAKNSPYQNCIALASKIHQNLEDISIAGKDADEYSLNEIAEIGERRHLKLYKKIEQQFISNQLSLTSTELEKLTE